MNNVIPIEALRIMDERFGCDKLISIATCVDNIPYVRAVNAYYENGAFYVITHALSNKMKQLEQNENIAVCGEWFTGHGTGENIGYILAEKNADIFDKLHTAFAEWYDNGHIDESDRNFIILRIRLTDGVLFADGVRYDLNFAGDNPDVIRF